MSVSIWFKVKSKDFKKWCDIWFLEKFNLDQIDEEENGYLVGIIWKTSQ